METRSLIFIISSLLNLDFIDMRKAGFRRLISFGGYEEFARPYTVCTSLVGWSTLARREDDEAGTVVRAKGFFSRITSARTVSVFMSAVELTQIQWQRSETRSSNQEIVHPGMHGWLVVPRPWSSLVRWHALSLVVDGMHQPHPHSS